MTLFKMKKRISKITKPMSVLMSLVFAGLLAGCTPEAQQMADTLAALQETQQAIVAELPETDVQAEQADLPQKGEAYYDLTNVVLYLEMYHELPDNYITKDEARDLGWEGGSVEDYKKGAAIGGDYFGNYEKILPDAGKGGYRECDIDTKGYKNRGSRRLIYTEDGQYYYSSDHYESFRQVIVKDDNSVELSDELLR